MKLTCQLIHKAFDRDWSNAWPVTMTIDTTSPDIVLELFDNKLGRPVFWATCLPAMKREYIGINTPSGGSLNPDSLELIQRECIETLEAVRAVSNWALFETRGSE